MPLEVRKTSRWWYGRYQHQGRIHCINLGIPIAGQRPAKLGVPGDHHFEQSRGRAQEALDRILLDLRRDKTEEQLLERLYQLRTGHSVRRVPLGDLAEAWENISRKHQPSNRYADQCRAVIRRFQAYIASHHPGVNDTTSVGQSMAKGFMDSEAGRGITTGTWNDVLKTMRTTFRHVLPNFHANPFAGILLKDVLTVHRKPFSSDDLARILRVAEHDDFVRPLVITAMCTAMRRGDCCLLRWEDVDLGKGFITTKTSKTGELVEIPIFPLLRTELLRWKGRSDDHVFPEQAKMYRVNPDGVSYRVGRVLHAAGFVPEAQARRGNRSGGDELASLPKEQLMAMAREQLVLGEGRTTAHKKRQNMLQALDVYLEGSDVGEVSLRLGISKGCVSNYLNEIEMLCRVRVVRRTSGNQGAPVSVIASKNAVRVDGRRKASLRDFHSFRVTWITLALGAGVPLELVKRVTGHRTADIVLKHYFRPDREAFRKTLQDAMPDLVRNTKLLPTGADLGNE